MIRFGLVICYFFAIFHNGNSDPINFNNRFFGGCPEIRSKSLSKTENMDGEWFIHWVTDNYSPWKYFQCESKIFVSTTSDDYSKITTKFTLPPFIPVPISMESKQLTKNKNEYSYNYDNSVLSNVPQKTVILEKLPSGVSLAWTCSDFKYFHFESYQVMTKYRDSPGDSKINEYALRNLANVIGKYGLLADFLVKVNQSC